MQFCYQSNDMKSFLIALVFFSGVCVNESWTTSVRNCDVKMVISVHCGISVIVTETMNVEQD